MKKLLILSVALLCGASAFAEDAFYPGFQWGLKGGVGYTIGESEKMDNLLSGAAAIDLGYQFSRLFTLRADISGWQGRGVNASLDAANPYKWTVNYVQLAFDAKFDIINMFAKQYKPHAVNPYLFVGAGGQYRFNNGAKLEMLPNENLLNQFKTFSYVGRAGAGIDFRVSRSVAIVLEYVENFTDDTFNSKKGDVFDHQMDLLLGINFRFGQAKKARQAEAAAAEAAAAAAAARLAAEQAAAAKAAAEKAAYEKALAEAMAAAQAALAKAQAALAENGDKFPQSDIDAINNGMVDVNSAIPGKVPATIMAAAVALNNAVDKANADLAARLAAEKAALEHAKLAAMEAFKDNNNDIFYSIGKSEITSGQKYKVNALVKKLKANPEAKAIICGFADKETGNADINMTLSEQRANKVKDAVVAAGIDPSRISVYAFGDTVKLSDVVSKNRVSVMVSE